MLFVPIGHCFVNVSLVVHCFTTEFLLVPIFFPVSVLKATYVVCVKPRSYHLGIG